MTGRHTQRERERERKKDRKLGGWKHDNVSCHDHVHVLPLE